MTNFVIPMQTFWGCYLFQSNSKNLYLELTFLFLFFLRHLPQIFIKTRYQFLVKFKCLISFIFIPKSDFFLREYFIEFKVDVETEKTSNRYLPNSKILKSLILHCSKCFSRKISGVWKFVPHFISILNICQ